MSERASLWGFRLLALALALLAWFFATVETRERTSQTVVEAFVSYSTGEELVILDPVDKVRVTVRGTESRIRRLNPFQVSVVVDLRAAEKGPLEIKLGPENVVLPDGIEFVSINPPLLPLEIDRMVTDMRPVVPRLSGEPAAGAVVLEPEVRPAAVLVRGPESELRQLDSVTTTAVSLDGHAIDFEEQAAVVSPNPLIRVVQPAVVTVRIPMEVPQAGASSPGRGR